MNQLEFRHVRAFLSVAQHLHFARAADALDMAPPALTRQIQEAERLLGVRLFQRSRRAVTLTAAGVAFLAEASAAFEHLQRGRELAMLAERGELGRIEIGYVSSAVYSGALQRTVGAFRAAHPRIELNLREVPMDDVAHFAADETMHIFVAINVPDRYTMRIDLTAGGQQAKPAVTKQVDTEPTSRGCHLSIDLAHAKALRGECAVHVFIDDKPMTSATFKVE